MLHNSSFPGGTAIQANTQAPLPDIEAIWNGVVHGVSGYAKANREILKRIILFANIRFATEMPWDPTQADEDVQALFSHHKAIEVSSRSPRVTFLPPRPEPQARYRVIYTMMETEMIHQDMIRTMNENYNECWTPTRWNAGTFQKSGLKIPIHVMPLGVDPTIYSPSMPAQMPKATLMTGHEAGREEIPKGFIFVYVFQPSFRKGVDFLLSAFEEAFSMDREAGLLLGTTAYSIEDIGILPNRGMKTRVWSLPGKYTERDLSAMYRACQAYVCTSRGEGFNMPAAEAAASGLPIIAPRTSVHPEMMPSGYGFFFDADGYTKFPDAKESTRWFDGISFPDYGVSSKRMLVEILRSVKKEYKAAQEIGRRYSSYVRSKYSWGSAARLVSERLRAISK